MSLDECQDVVEVLTDLLEGALPSEDHNRVLAHLDGCEGCRVWLEQLKLTVTTLGRLDVAQPQLPPGVVDAVRAAIDDRRLNRGSD